MSELNCIILCFISGFATNIANLVLFFDSKSIKNILDISFGLLFSVMTFLSIELLYSGYVYIYDLDITKKILFIMSGFLIGYFSIYIFDSNRVGEDEYYNIGKLNMISLLLHNIPEGIVCAISSLNNYRVGIRLTIAIMIHNIPEGLGIVLPIYYSSNNRFKAFIFTFISSLGEILGCFITLVFLKKYITLKILSFLYFIIVGIMATLSIKKILLYSIHNNKLLFILGSIIGIIICFIT